VNSARSARASPFRAAKLADLAPPAPVSALDVLRAGGCTRPASLADRSCFRDMTACMVNRYHRRRERSQIDRGFDGQPPHGSDVFALGMWDPPDPPWSPDPPPSSPWPAASGESRQGHGGTGSPSRRSRLEGFLPGVGRDQCSGHAETRPGTVRRSRTIIVEYSGSTEYFGDYSAQNSPASQNAPRKFVGD